jgi:hypothetical protein
LRRPIEMDLAIEMALARLPAGLNKEEGLGHASPASLI